MSSRPYSQLVMRRKSFNPFHDFEFGGKRYTAYFSPEVDDNSLRVSPNTRVLNVIIILPYVSSNLLLAPYLEIGGKIIKNHLFFTKGLLSEIRKLASVHRTLNE